MAERKIMFCTAVQKHIGMVCETLKFSGIGDDVEFTSRTYLCGLNSRCERLFTSTCLQRELNSERD